MFLAISVKVPNNINLVLLFFPLIILLYNLLTIDIKRFIYFTHEISLHHLQLKLSYLNHQIFKLNSRKNAR